MDTQIKSNAFSFSEHYVTRKIYTGLDLSKAQEEARKQGFIEEGIITKENI